MERFTIFAKKDALSQNIANKIIRAFKAAGRIIDDVNPELCIVIGGDGKMLRAVHQYLDRINEMYFVGILTGTLGFSSDYKASEVDLFIKEALTNVYTVKAKNLLQIELTKKDRSKKTYYALNEFRVENRVHTCVLDVFINDQLFEEFRGNGMIVSTPFGSTAYNRSLGGAIIFDHLDAFQLTEVAGIHHTSYSSIGNSLIISNNNKLTIKIQDTHQSLLGLDHLIIPSDGIVEVEIGLCDRSVNFIHYHPITCVDRLKKAYIRDK